MLEKTLEQRIEALEQEVRVIKLAIQKLEKDEQPWWISQAGVFKDDPLFDEMVVIGQQIRKSQI